MPSLDIDDCLPRERPDPLIARAPGARSLGARLSRDSSISDPIIAERAVDGLAVVIDQPEDPVDLLRPISRPGVDARRRSTQPSRRGSSSTSSGTLRDGWPGSSRPARTPTTSTARPALSRPRGQDLGEARGVRVDAVDQPRPSAHLRPARVHRVAQPAEVGVLGVAMDDRMVRIGGVDLCLISST